MTDKNSPHGKNKTAAETQLIHDDRHPHDYEGFVNTPTFRGSTVLFPDAKTLTTNNQPYTYGRYGTPSTTALEQALAQAEQAAGCCLTPSGLSAITTSLMAFVQKGDHILIADSVYYPTRNFCDHLQRSFNIEVTYFDPTLGERLDYLFQKNTRLIFLEAPGSLSMDMCDLRLLSDIAHRHNALVMTDNTWASPLLCQPLTLGVDISVQACTKYVSGHSDAMLGAILYNEKTGQQLRDYHRFAGNCAGSEEVFLATRGLRTLAVRLNHHEKSALTIAHWLQDHPMIDEVYYPALESNAGHALWKRDFSGACGLFSVSLHQRDKTKIHALLDALKLFGMGWSWGGFESLVVPYNLSKTRSAVAHQDRINLRLHIGLENVEDLQADLEQGLEKLA